MTDITQPPYHERGGEQRAAQQERDTAAAFEKAAEQGQRTYQPATSAQFTPEAAGTETREDSGTAERTGAERSESEKTTRKTKSRSGDGTAKSE